jgi:hypothetical protein
MGEEKKTAHNSTRFLSIFKVTLMPMSIRLGCIATFLLILISIQLNSQQKINWIEIEKQSFVQDSSPYIGSDKYFQKQFHFLPNTLEESKANLEIRIIPGIVTENNPLTIFQFFDDSTFLYRYYRLPDVNLENLMKKYRDSSAEVYSKIIGPLIEKHGGYIWKMEKKTFTAGESYHLLKGFIDRQLFTISEQNEFLQEEIRLQHSVLCSDTLNKPELKKGMPVCNKGYIFEINLKNRIRRFQSCLMVFYYFENNGNRKEVERFIACKNLVQYVRPFVAVKRQDQE